MPLQLDALYYPYININSVNWLKSTLLCFPHVCRIVPSGFNPNDNAAIRSFTDTKGIDGKPLLIDVAPNSEACLKEQARLATLITQNLKAFQKHFSKEATLSKHPTNGSRYEIFGGKLELKLLNTLYDLNLAWQETKWWYTMHPTLGRAVMATIAVSIANDRGLDIVTPDNSVHRSVCSQRQEDVFDELTGNLRNAPPNNSEGIVHELASVFITTHFNVSKLSVQDIVALQKDGKDLSRFKNAILPIASEIPDIPDKTERNRRLKKAAAEINSEWKKYKKSLPRKMFETVFDVGESKLPTSAAAILGASTYIPFGLVAGIAVGITTFAGWRMWDKFREGSYSPYQYLNRIHRAGATLHVPTGVEQN